LSLLIFKVALEYVIRSVQAKQEVLKLMAYLNVSLLLMMLMCTVNKNTDTPIAANKEIVLEENIDKTKYIVMFRVQNAGQITT